ncbi:MAG: hypothetical protein IAC61_02150 [Firmicutes bacterium]|uniref:Lipoprotein n=1 Tax=Candidatus Alloenteromonas pullistercoris TaxID=2840785 RepID=A0A9D9DGM8_9FIRM|nr:hypothetical protein [Candidatus Enteromonas pullistercoris]
MKKLYLLIGLALLLLSSCSSSSGNHGCGGGGVCPIGRLSDSAYVNR